MKKPWYGKRIPMKYEGLQWIVLGMVVGLTGIILYQISKGG